MTSVAQTLRRAGTSKGLRHALRLVQLEWILNRRHRRSVKKLRDSMRGDSELLKPGWINIDLLDPNADAQLDLREDWPFTTVRLPASIASTFLST